ncbi:hypothetical protein P872_10720 [Rhodonellum psychrophilum GCM71 = DSM 17998]|uniref:Uncharacterized protein n=1 Tax=Rhodonellum psychrophilum GCM71 = DSM 17998 TaxID=1123057 RepID=U5BZC2_9BACT|nr:hypothetical protein P872_10720 [Rhodonellum psychrophilum GCM71 = DSM 17998]
MKISDNLIRSFEDIKLGDQDWASKGICNWNCFGWKNKKFCLNSARIQYFDSRWQEFKPARFQKSTKQKQVKF